MKNTLTQKLRDKQILYHPLRTYFDMGSSEFNRTDLDEKISTLAKIVLNGFDLGLLIDEYKSRYGSDNNKYIVDSIVPALKRYLREIDKDRFNWVTLQNLSDAEVIKNLTELLKTRNDY